MAGRLERLTGAAVLLAAMTSCEAYTRTNPYDPGAPFQYSIVGPDTIYSLGQVANYSVVSTPALSDTAGIWDCDCSEFGSSGVAGTFQLSKLDGTLWPATKTVKVTAFIGKFDSSVGPGQTHGIFDRRELSRTVVLTQRLVRILLRCPDIHACSALPPGSEWTLWVDGFDALGSQISGLTNFTTINPTTGTPIAAFVSRDAAIASVSPVGIRAASVTSLKTGSTWIVATRDLLRDSIQVIVK